jgi:hypothetical protein
MIMVNCTMQEQIVAMLGDYKHHEQFAPVSKNKTSPASSSDSSSRTSSSSLPSVTNTTTTSTVQPSTTACCSMAQVEALLDELVDATHQLLHKEKLLDQSIHDHLQLATTAARNDQQLDVILCMNQVHTLQLQKHRVQAAIQLLEHYIATLEAQLYDESVVLTLRTESSEPLLLMDIREPQNYTQHVQRIFDS